MKEKAFEMGEGRDKYRLYKATLEDALTTDYEGEKDESKEARTNIWLSLWLRKVFADMRLYYDMPSYMIMSRTIRLGASIVQHEYKDKFHKLSSLWSEIRWSDNEVVKQLETQEYTVNGMSNSKRVFVRMPKWCSEMLGSITGSLRSDKSSMIRLAIYHAITRSDEIISHKNREYAKEEIAKFDKQIADSIKFLEVVVTYFETGKECAEDSQEEKDLKKEGEKI